MSRSSKILQYINYRMRVTIRDGRQLVGRFMAFDRHMNLVLGDCEEFRRVPAKKGSGLPKEEREEQRTLGLVLLRGEEVVSMTVEGPPVQDDPKSKAGVAGQPGPGLGRAAGRGIPTAPLLQPQPGLAAPARGVGGPSPAIMLPQISRPPPMAFSMPPGVPLPGARPPASAPPAAPQGFQAPHPGLAPPQIIRPPGATPLSAPPPGGPAPAPFPAPPRAGLPPPPGPPPSMPLPSMAGPGMPPPFGLRPIAPPPQMMRGPPPPGPPPIALSAGPVMAPPPTAPPRPMPPPAGAQMFGAPPPPRPGMPPPPPPQQQPSTQQ